MNLLSLITKNRVGKNEKESQMQEYKIIEYGTLNKHQKEQAIEIFIEGFGHMMTFSKDKNVLKKLFLSTFNSNLFMCYVENEKVLGIMGIATNKVRPVKFEQEVCKELFGKIKGNILCKQMNAIFQKPVVNGDRELYIDVLATASDARGKGVATILLNYAFDLKEYDDYSIEVFSKNETAIRLYKKVGFISYKKEKFTPMAFMGAGYPILMKKVG